MKRAIVLLVVGLTATPVLAEDPVYFPDANLKAAVEAELGIPDPTPTDMLGLTYLSANYSGIVDLTGLEYAENITYLDLVQNEISDISALSGLINLQYLGLWSNQISDITPLSGLTNLNGLQIYYNQISDISPLSGLTNLQVLELGRNQINDISPLSALIKLQDLLLEDNQISDISPLSGLTNLYVLIINDNQISDISPLAGLINLDELQLNHNQISAISPLSALTNLQELELDDNQITDISALSGLTSLWELRLSYNEISDIQSLVDNLGLDGEDYEYVMLLENPLSYKAIYTDIPVLLARGVTVYFDERTPTTLVMVSGDGQTGKAGSALAEPFVVQVFDENSEPFEGVPVTFSVTAGDGSLDVEAATTDSDGRAQATLTLGLGPGLNTVRVTAAHIASPVTFYAIAEPEPPWSFVQITDLHIGYDDADEALEAVVDEISNLSPAPDFVLVTGDIADFGCDKDNDCFNPSHYDTFNIIMGSLNIPYYVIPGNHDWKSSKHENLYDVECDNDLCCYASKINKPSGTGTFPKSSSVGNYWFQHNEFVFIGLDTGYPNYHSSLAISDDQMDDLEWIGNSLSKPKIVFMHHPADDVTPNGITQNKYTFSGWCIENDVKVVIAGHTHFDNIKDFWGFSWDVGEETGYIQTPSCGKGDPQGYRIFGVEGGVVYAREVSGIQDTLDEMERARAHSPVKLHAYDSQGNHVGVNPSGGIDREILGSYFLPHYNMETEDGTAMYPEKILIFRPSDDYLYEIIGTEEGTYGLDVTSVSGGNEIMFEATDIPTLLGARHVYTLDWDALSAGNEGVTLEIDADADGVFERTVIADEDLTPAEFALQTQAVIDFEPDTFSIEKNKGKFISAHIELPNALNPSEIDISTLRIRGMVSARVKPAKLGDYDSDGIKDLIIRFDQQEVIELLGAGEHTVELSGRLRDGTRFGGVATIIVIGA